MYPVCQMIVLPADGGGGDECTHAFVSRASVKHCEASAAAARALVPRRTLAIIAGGAPPATQVLTEAKQQLPDGRVRSRGIPLSEKLLPGEDWREAALRAVAEELGSALQEGWQAQASVSWACPAARVPILLVGVRPLNPNKQHHNCCVPPSPRPQHPPPVQAGRVIACRRHRAHGVTLLPRPGDAVHHAPRLGRAALPASGAFRHARGGRRRSSAHLVGVEGRGPAAVRRRGRWLIGRHNVAGGRFRCSCCPQARACCQCGAPMYSSSMQAAMICVQSVAYGVTGLHQHTLRPATGGMELSTQPQRRARGSQTQTVVFTKPLTKRGGRHASASGPHGLWVVQAACARGRAARPSQRELNVHCGAHRRMCHWECSRRQAASPGPAPRAVTSAKAQCGRRPHAAGVSQGPDSVWWTCQAATGLLL